MSSSCQAYLALPGVKVESVAGATGGVPGGCLNEMTQRHEDTAPDTREGARGVGAALARTTVVIA